MLVPQTTPPFPIAWGFSTKLDAPESLPKPELSQIHGCAVMEAKGAAQEADGIWTARPGLRIGVRVADCVPILLAGRLKDGRPWASALHAGWKGATQGIFRRGVEVFVQLGGDPSQLTFAFGPAIQACHFEVGGEVLDAARADAAWQEGLSRPGPRGKPHLDLHGFLQAQARHLGLDPAKDGSLPLCTMCQTDLLWSYRRGDATARQWGWIEVLA